MTEEQDYLEEAYNDDMQDSEKFIELHLQDALRERIRNERKINQCETEFSKCSKLIEAVNINKPFYNELNDHLIDPPEFPKHDSKSSKAVAESGWEIISDAEISGLECKYNNIDDPWILVNPSYVEQINWGTLNEEIEMPPVVPIYEAALGDEEDIMKFCCLGCMKMGKLTKCGSQKTKNSS